MTTVKPPAPPAIPDELTAVLRRIRLPYLRAAAPEVLATARAQRWERVVDAAYVRRSVAVTSNLHPSGFDTIMQMAWPPPPTASCTTPTSSSRRHLDPAHRGR